MLGGGGVVFLALGPHFPHHTDSARFCALLREHLANTQPISYSKDQWRALLRHGRPLPPTLPSTLPPTLEPNASPVRELARGHN